MLLREREVLEELSPSLRMRVALLVNKAIIETVPFFWGCSGNFIVDIIRSLVCEYLCVPGALPLLLSWVCCCRR